MSHHAEHLHMVGSVDVSMAGEDYEILQESLVHLCLPHLVGGLDHFYPFLMFPDIGNYHPN